MLARPGKFRWDYSEPAQLIVSDGVTVWLYDEELAQVTVRPAAEALIGTPALLLSGQADVASEFRISDGGAEGGLDWTRLEPKDPESDFKELRVGIALAQGPWGLGVDIALAMGDVATASAYLAEIPDALLRVEQWQARARRAACLSEATPTGRAACLEEAQEVLNQYLGSE